jgi:hypothetical protein
MDGCGICLVEAMVNDLSPDVTGTSRPYLTENVIAVNDNPGTI